MPISTNPTGTQFAIQRSFLVDQVLSLLRTQISSGEYKEGDRLPSESELCQRFNVGRSTIREALRVLSHLGLVETWVGKGTFVCRHEVGAVSSDPMPIREIVDICQFRYCIEPVAVEMAARIRTQDDLRQINTAHVFLKEAIRGQSLEDIVNRDFDLHLSIVAASGNALFAKLYGEQREALVRATFNLVKVATLSDSASQDSPMSFHNDLLEAIERQDPTTALKAVRRDERETQMLLRILEQQAMPS